MLAAAALLLTLPLLAFSAPVAESEPQSLEKRQNGTGTSSEIMTNPFGGWNKGQNVTALIKEMEQTTTYNDKNALMPKDGYVFNFLKAAFFGGGGKDGGVVLADNQINPATVKNGLSNLMGFIGPCGMVAPHNHPRATESLIHIAGPPLFAGSFHENGAQYFSGNMEAGSVVMLPEGSIHFITNTGCDPAFIVAAFNNESPGVGFLATAYANIDTETINAAFGGYGAQQYNPAGLPNTVILGQDKCLAKCGMDRSTFNIQGKVSGKDLSMMAMAGYLKAEGYNWNDDAWKHWA